MLLGKNLLIVLGKIEITNLGFGFLATTSRDHHRDNDTLYTHVTTDVTESKEFRVETLKI